MWCWIRKFFEIILERPHEAFGWLSKGIYIPISTEVSRFLFPYRISIHSTPGTTPAKRMFCRELSSQLGALISEETRIQDKGIIEIKAFMLGEQVHARDFRKWVQETKCTRSVVAGRLGKYIYLMKPEGPDLTWRRHSELVINIFGLEASTADVSFDTNIEGEM